MASNLPLESSNNANVPKAKKAPSKARAAGKTIEEMYQKKSQLEHILLRPDTYIGSIEKHTQTLWVHENDEMVNRPVTYVPGLYKIFDEILVNAADNKQRDPSMDSLKVVIDVEQNLISVWNNGDGVPVEIHQEEGVYVPEMIFGHLLTSSNYDDGEKKTTGGRNGYGAKLTNIFSTEFTIETADGKRLKKYKQVFENNMGKKSEPVITKCNKSENWTKVTFKPDLSKFSMTELEDDVVALMSKRVFDIAGCLGQTKRGVKVELNGKLIPVKSFSDYVDLYLSAANKSRTDPLPRLTEKVNGRWEVCVSLSEGQFQQVSFVNSIATIKGGTHVDYVTSQITNYIAAIVNKKLRKDNVKTHNVKNHLWVFVNALIDNPAFDSQTKETLTLRQSSFGSDCKLSEDILKKVAKSGVVENLLSWATFKQSKELKKTDGAKTHRVSVEKLEDANEAGGKNSQKCTLILTEGDSAKALAVAGLAVVGRDYYGVFPLRGKLLNVREASTTQITNNKEIENIKKILGLKQHMKYENVTSLRYGHMMIMTDQDHDGSHIKGLLINFIHSFWPSLLKVPSFLVEFITPIIKATKNKKVLSFYSMPEYESWKESLNSNATGWTIKYYKGLGTSTSAEGKEYFGNLGLHKKDFVWEDELDGEAIELAFSKKKIEERKTWLLNFDPSNQLDQKEQKITYSDFVNKELILFSMADVQRSIPSMVDGLKPGQRKIIFCSFKRNFTKEAKVAQFSGYVSEHSAYHHGEQSLAGTIVGMAQDYVGSNNINLLQPGGQFGTRNMGGKDAASPRYIYTKLSPVTRILFPKDDDVLLNYLNEDGQKIEPTWYMPIIPTVLVNGCEGIGTGWSSFIPNYNPREIIANVRRLLNGESMVPMDPWYRGFKGTIEKTATKETGSTYTITGIYEEVDETTIRITELPIRRWTGDYREFLETMKTDNVPFIQDIRSYHDDTSVDFELQLSEANMLVARQEGFLKTFKLTTTIGTTNMHLFDEFGVIKKYATPEQIIEEFFNLRLRYYELRKKIMLENLELELLKLENKVKFILGVVSGEIIVNNRKKADLVEELKQRGFTPFPKKSKPVEAAVAGAMDGTEEAEESSDAPASSSTFIHGSEYDYLLSLAISTLTIEKVNELLANRDKMKEEVEELKKATPRSLWLKDLQSLEAELDNLDLGDAIAEEDRKKAQKKLREKAGKPARGQKQASKKPAVPKKPTTKKPSESETIEVSTNSAMDTDNNVVEVAKPKGRQAAKKKAPAPAAKEVDEDEMMDLASRLAQYNFGAASENSSKETAETSKAIAVDDDDDVVEVAPAKKGRKPAASKVAKPPAAPRKRGPAASKKQAEEVVTIVSPEKKVRKMRSSPFNKKSSSVMAAIANKEKEEESSSDIMVEKQRPQRANRKQMRYVLSDSESESGNDSEFDDIEDIDDDE